MAKRQPNTSSTPKQSQLDWLKPIRFSTHNVAVMVQFAGEDFAAKTGESVATIRAIAAERIPPTKAILNQFNLQDVEGAYLWDWRPTSQDTRSFQKLVLSLALTTR